MSPFPQASTPTHSSSETARFPVWIRIGFWVCIAIAVAVVIRRAVALGHPSAAGPPELTQLDTYFASHAALTLAHILPALLFTLLLPFFFTSRFGQSKTLHESLFFLGAIIGVTAYAMSAHAVGGWIERSAVLFFNTLYLYSLIRAYGYARSARLVDQRRWMTRAVGILLGIATTRPVMGVFFATSPITHLQPSQFFGIAFWIGFSINTIAIELWLRKSAIQPHIERMASPSRA